MFDEPKMSTEEWDLVTELLECERDELPVEIRHTGNEEVRAELRRREELVRSLLARLRQPIEVGGLSGII